MATINVYRVIENSFIVVVGELRDNAPIIGFAVKPNATPESAIEEFKEKLGELGSILFIIQGGTLDLPKVLAANPNPELYTSFECDQVDAEDFA